VTGPASGRLERAGIGIGGKRKDRIKEGKKYFPVNLYNSY
jgi:hypothetical protein